MKKIRFGLYSIVCISLIFFVSFNVSPPTIEGMGEIECYGYSNCNDVCRHEVKCYTGDYLGSYMVSSICDGNVCLTTYRITCLFGQTVEYYYLLCSTTIANGCSWD